jgi:hypothetical protein
MEEELNIENMLGADDIENLFTDEGNEDTQPKNEDKSSEEDKENKDNKTTEVDVNNLFDDSSESVGSEDKEDNKETKEKKDTTDTGSKTSPNKKSFYSSITDALVEEGIFPDLDEETISKVNTPEDFRDLIDKQIKAGLDEKQKRISEALDYGIEPSEIKKYENTIDYLDSLDDSKLSVEGEEGENLRKQLIYQDYINRGWSKERASREVQKALNAGTDIEDAKEALKSNKEFFQSQYDKLIEEARKEDEAYENKRKEQAENLKKSILEDRKVFGDIEIDKNTRQKVFDNISKPIYKDPDTGELLTAVQKYERENSLDFIKNIGLIYTLTNGFKNLDGLVKGKVKKEMKGKLRELENVINNTSRTSDGNLKFSSGVSADEDYFIGNGFSLDI